MSKNEPKAKKVKKVATSRITLNIPVELINKYTELSEKRGVSRTSLMIIALSDYFDNKSVLDNLPEFLKALNQANNNP